MLQQSPWRSNYNIHCPDIILFCLQVFASNDKRRTEIVEISKRSKYFKSLNAKFARGHQNQGPESIHRRPA